MDWGNNAEWIVATIGIVITALIALVAIFYQRGQLRQARQELDDKRLDERVEAILGRNILTINSLSDQANMLLAESTDGLNQTRELRREVESLGSDLKEDMKTAAQQLQEMLEQARLLTSQIDARAKQAQQDADEITTAKKELTERWSLSDAVRLQLIRDGFAVTAFDTSLPEHQIDLVMERGRDKRKPLLLFIDTMTMDRGDHQTSRSQIQRTAAKLNSNVTQMHGDYETFKIVVVSNLMRMSPNLEREIAERYQVKVLGIDQLEPYVQGLIGSGS